MARTKKYPGHIRRRGNSFRVALYAGGQRYEFTVQTTDRRIAEDRARLQYAELRRNVARQRQGLPEPMCISGVFAKFEAERLPLLAPNTRSTYQASIAMFRQFFVGNMGDPPVDRVRSGHVKDFLNWRRTHCRQGKRSLSNRTIQKDRTTLHGVFAFAEELELREGNPVTRVTAPKADSRDPVILDDNQYARLVAACEENPMLRLYVLAMGETGARCESELLYLQWEDVDLEKGFIWIASGRDEHRTKSGKGRWVPMTQELRTAMRQHFADFRFAGYAGQASPWVFHHMRSRRRVAAGDRIGCLRTSFKAAAARAGLPENLHQHDLRHRRATTWLAAGKSPVHVKEALGHSDLRTTMGYTHLAREHLLSLVTSDVRAAGRVSLSAVR